MFKTLKRSKTNWARYGILKTPHGEIETPAFVPVATQAALKGLLPQQAENAGTQILMVNTYHLWVRSAVEAIEKLGGPVRRSLGEGGLHTFMNWQKPLMTDSGGFQVFSLGWAYKNSQGKISKEGVQVEKPYHLFHDREKDDILKRKDINKKGLAKIDEEGVTFRSHLDGSLKRLTPEISIQMQEKLGADIIFAFDECTSPTASYEYTKNSLIKTHRWAKESLKAKKRKDQLLFGIIQGGRYQDLREESAKFVGSLEFDGIGIGGGFGKEDITTALEWVIPLLPKDKPRHFLGIGEIEDIKESIKRGVDFFDCVIPTRLARHGVLITKKGRVTIANSKWRMDKNPPEKDCSCFTCQNFSRAYLCHLARAGEMTAIQLADIHNIYFYNKLMEEIREEIKNGRIQNSSKRFKN
ncbi:MAG: tRNA guanosine(34) transglycosylase Tgt [Candidatus Portnoybacteria bacterium]|nr:tRNA guanosine(34) transglycosylase Tgt [Candidatus Portnoybacteria bacterium]